MKKILFLILLLQCQLFFSQETVGLVFDDTTFEKADGYTLFNVMSDRSVYLINNCGEAVNQWGFVGGDNSRAAYLRADGSLIQSNSTSADIRDWNDNLIWSIKFDDFGISPHHDIEPLPNGNILFLTYDVLDREGIIELGKDSSFEGEIFILDGVVEMKPLGADSATIVWEWHFFDHMIQNVDSSKLNFGSIGSNPQLLDMNYDAVNEIDYTHGNGLDYNSELDQILISARHTQEIYIIDHSTTTAEAASHSGGIYGKGGDFLWRWGNPEVYDSGAIQDRKIGKQHDPKWIEHGIHKGKISVFSNVGYGINEMASSIHILDPNAEAGIYNIESNKFLPTDYFWSYDGTILDEVMFAAIMSGVQIMNNGNALIMESPKGRITEVDTAGNVIWVYEIPIGNNTTFNQFETPTGNGSFRANRYPKDYLNSLETPIVSLGIIENLNNISENCSKTLSVENSFFNSLTYYPNPTRDYLNFRFTEIIENIDVIDLTGKLVLNKKFSNFVDLQVLESGMYLVGLSVGEESRFIKILKQ